MSSPAGLSEALKRALHGERLSPADGLLLLREAPLPELAALADRARFRLNPERVVTYIVDRNINYTNVCTSRCRFCAFYRPPEHPEAYLLSAEEIGHKVEEALAHGAAQILLQGGLNPRCDLAYFEGLFRQLKERYRIHLHALSPPEIRHLARLEGRPTAEIIRRLVAAGLDSIPGGGAEVLSADTRRRVSPEKGTPEEWLAVMREAHGQGLKTTATMMFGVGERLPERLEHLLAVRALQDETGGFTAFIPWTFQPRNTALEQGAPHTGAVQYLRLLAVSRLVLDNISHLQVSWVTQGADLAQVALRFGADDFGSTMLEENVVAAAGVSFRISEAEIRARIGEAGFRPCRRQMDYRHLEEE